MHIFEAITAIPNLNIFFRYRKKESNEIIQKIKSNMAVFFAYENSKNEDYDFYFFNKIFHDVVRPYPYQINKIIENVEGLETNSEAVLKFGKDFIRHFTNRLEWLDKDLQDDMGNITSWSTIYDNNKSDLEYEFEHDKENPEYIELTKALIALQNVGNTLMKLFKNNKRYLAIMKERGRLLYYSYEPKGYKPEHEEIEKLYHVTLYTNDILKSGFQKEKPEHMKGVGNLGTQDNISFTHSLVTAQSILRAFRDIWMIVHGQIKASTIHSWIENEGMQHEEISKNVRGLIGGGGKGTKYIPENLKQLLYLYRVYLYSQQSRIDPVIMNWEELGESMKTIDYKNIGILVCDVQLTGKEEYLQAEDEFRVPPSQILSIKKLF